MDITAALVRECFCLLPGGIGDTGELRRGIFGVTKGTRFAGRAPAFTVGDKPAGEPSSLVRLADDDEGPEVC